jgi:hypothetical protein
MKKFEKICFIILILSTAFSSCRKDILQFDSDFVGFWTTEMNKYGPCNHIIDIASDGHFNYYCPTNISDCKRVEPNISGPAKSNDKSIRVGIHFFAINQKPTKIDTISVNYDTGSTVVGKSVMQMQIEGKIYYKIIGVGCNNQFEL